MTETLWSPRQNALGSAAVAVGFALVIWSWWGASGQVTASKQHDWIALGVAGDGLVLVASLGWLVHGRRHVVAALAALLEWLPAPTAPSPSAARSPAAMALPVAASDTHLYHRPDCQFAQGRPVHPAVSAGHERAGRRPCPVCRP